MKPLLIIFLFCSSFSGLQAQQYFSGIASRWSDDFSEWNIYTAIQLEEGEDEPDPDDVEPTGELKMRWPNRGDWNTWDFSVGDERGYIKTLFTDDPGKWELVGTNNEVITFRQIWANDKREWRVTNNKTQLTFKSRWGNRIDEWMVKGEKYGDFHIYTSWEGDPRDWTIVDDLGGEISTSMKMALVFIAVFVGSE